MKEYKNRSEELRDQLVVKIADEIATDRKELVFVKWYTNTAVYLDGKLVFWGEFREGWGLLTALGHHCRTLGEVPTNDFIDHFPFSDANGWWKPPQELKVLERQFAAWERHKAEDRVKRATAELSFANKQLEALNEAAWASADRSRS